MLVLGIMLFFLGSFFYLLPWTLRQQLMGKHDLVAFALFTVGVLIMIVGVLIGINA